MPRVVAAPSLLGLIGDEWRRSGNLGVALADALRGLVVDGRVAARTRVPSERALAAALGVSRGTVTRAYDRLRSDGYLVSARGAGTWLTLPAGAQPALTPPGAASPDAIDLSVAALPAPEPLLAAAAARAVAALSRHAASHGYAPAGLSELREAIAARFAERGLPTSPEQVLVTAGAQHALHLLLSLVAAPGDRVLVDVPAYPRTLSALCAARTRPVPVPLAPGGWDADAWRHAIAAVSPALAVTLPDFHNPTGMTMAPADRAAIVKACERAGVMLVADETNTELRLDGPPVPEPVAAYDQGGTVVTVGSLSKAAWGGVRIGWIRAAPRLVRELTATRAVLDMASPVLEQLLAVELMARWHEVIDSRRALLRPRRDTLIAALARHAPSWTAMAPLGGLGAWVRLPAPVATRLAVAAARAGVLVSPGPAFSVDGAFEHHLRLPFTAPPDDLRVAVETLARIASRLRDDAPEPVVVAGGVV